MLVGTAVVRLKKTGHLPNVVVRLKQKSVIVYYNPCELQLQALLQLTPKVEEK
jgi:hypothetical protein